MPGFNIGGGGDGPDSKLELLFNHRWIIEQLGPISRDQLIIARDLMLPDLKIERQEINGGTIIYKFAKSVKWDDVQVTFYDDGNILNEIRDWLELVYTNDEGIKSHAPSGGYKQECKFKLLGGEGKAINTIVLKNAWPVSVSQGKLTYTNSDIKLITLTLAYDWAENRG